MLKAEIEASNKLKYKHYFLLCICYLYMTYLIFRCCLQHSRTLNTFWETHVPENPAERVLNYFATDNQSVRLGLETLCDF